MKTKINSLLKLLILSYLLLITNCKTEELLKVTKLYTGTVDPISYNSATVTGSFGDLSGNVTTYGHCWNTTGNPDINDSKYTVPGTAKIGPFTSYLTGLLGNKTYYIRAFAMDGGETIYGDENSFITLAEPSIAISSPSITSHWGGGESYYITWIDDISENVTIQLVKGTTPTLVIDIESGIGVPSNGSYKWDMQNTINDGTDYKIKITSITNPTISGLSDFFEIAKPPKDYDNNVYKIVWIGGEWWMRENLKTKHFNGGTSIPNITDQTAWQSLTNISLAYCYYNNNETIGNTYGILYTYSAATYGICPVGWHIPTDKEWQTLEYNIGMSASDTSLTGWRGTVGKKLKESGTVHWSSPNSGDDNTEFTALPAGSRDDNGYFGGIYSYAYFWTATSNSSNNAWHRGLKNDLDQIARSSNLKRYGRSVRCIKD
jgi:uncharacterized protein (TIGR02145 family)